VCGCCKETPADTVNWAFTATPGYCYEYTGGVASIFGGASCSWRGVVDNIAAIDITISINEDCTLTASISAASPLGCDGFVTWESVDSIDNCQVFPTVRLFQTGAAGTLATYYEGIDLDVTAE
jgi:hypothetical protein